MTEKASAEVIPFSKSAIKKERAARCVPLKIRGEVTFTKPRTLSMQLRQPSLALSGGELPDRLLEHLKNLDDEQLQIVEIFVAAMERGAL